MPAFTIESPAVIHFGPGSLQKLRDVVQRAVPDEDPARPLRVLLVSGGTWLSSSGWVEKVRQLLPAMDIRCHLRARK